jgi:CheY-like chemotaxis protein
MGKKILVVDDDPEILNVLRHTFEALGHQVKICDHGNEVMEALYDYKPDLLVLDVMLPGIDGYSLTDQISDNADFNKLPIIILSALEPSRAMFQRFAQVRAFLTKPINMDDMTEAVNTGLKPTE